MRNNARIIEILLAGPSDVKKELQVVRNVINDWNAAHSRTDNTSLDAIHWDTHAFPEIGDRPQNIINKQLVDKCDLLIAVFWKSIGSPTGVAASGTIEEIERFRSSGRPVMLYFSEARFPYGADMNKIAQVRQYRDHLNDALYSVFKSVSELRQHLTIHLPQAIAQLRQTVAGSAGIAPAVKLRERTALVNRIEAELETTQVVQDFPPVLEQLRPLLLDCIASPNVTKIREARQNFQSLIRRVSELERFSFSSGTLAQYSDKCDELFRDIRFALEQAAAIDNLGEWEVVRYDDLKTKQAEHTGETAWNWADEKQCQCPDCVEFRALKHKIKDDLNRRFRAFFLQLEEQFLRLHSQKDFEPASIWMWIDTNARNAKRFQESFQIQGQSQNAHLAERVTHVFGQISQLATEERNRYSQADVEKLFGMIEPVVQMFAGLKGPS